MWVSSWCSSFLQLSKDMQIRLPGYQTAYKCGFCLFLTDWWLTIHHWWLENGKMDGYIERWMEYFFIPKYKTHRWRHDYIVFFFSTCATRMQYMTSPVDGSSASQSVYQHPIKLVEEEMCFRACWRHIFPPWRRLPGHHCVPPENSVSTEDR